MAMKKATVTYTAPAGESKTLEIGGTVLVSGKADTLICEADVMDKLKNASASSPTFKVDGVTDYTPPPPKAEPEPKKDKPA